MRNILRNLLFLILILASSQVSYAVINPQPEEMSEQARWIDAKFNDIQPAGQMKPGLIVLANYGPVQQNARDGQPLKIAEKQFTHGLYCHAQSKIIVRLPGPAQSFSAAVGIDTNGQYSGGSAVFSVSAAGKELFRSKVMLRGEPAAEVKVDLTSASSVEPKGATEFVIAVGDGGDNINSDQSDWAEAKVTLADGKEVWLGDMPIVEAGQAQYSFEPPFSFTYDGRSSKELLKDWKLTRSSAKPDDLREEHTLSFLDPKMGLLVRCVCIEYKDFPTVEWVVYFKNTGQTDTPIIENIQAIDTNITRGSKGEFVLHYIKGDMCTPDSYQPLEDTLAVNSSKRIANVGGRPTNYAFPYYNIHCAKEGVIYVLSWAGQWATQFTRDDALNLQITGGQELTHFKLHPGEEVRSPLVVLQFYRGDWRRGQNLWRRWMLAHSMPKPLGRPLQPQASLCTGNYYPLLMTVADQEMKFIKRHIEEKIVFDNWWQDAGWYPCDGVGWPKTGTWEVDKKRFPNGIRELSDYLRSHGIRTMVWFEPERVQADTWLSMNHPEWIHGGANGGLLKLGNPECRQWLTQHISKILKDEGIGFYRQDFNIDPLEYWRASDTADRQGITEIRHVEGYFAYWDGLMKDHPNLMIDSCASGGRRNDLETMRRAVPMLRSDYYHTPEGQQCQTYGLSFWLLFQGTGVMYSPQWMNDYWVRSTYVAEFTFGPGPQGLDIVDFDQWRKWTSQWREIAPDFLGDYYPLTPYSLEASVWIAWQFDRPEPGEGVVQAFRRPNCFYESARFKLQGLDADARYTITDIDSETSQEITGRQLMENGLLVTITEPASAAVIKYKKTGSADFGELSRAELAEVGR